MLILNIMVSAKCALSQIYSSIAFWLKDRAILMSAIHGLIFLYILFG